LLDERVDLSKWRKVRYTGQRRTDSISYGRTEGFGVQEMDLSEGKKEGVRGRERRR